MLSETTKPQSDAQIDEALADAHLPSLMMSLVHLTGDASLLSDDMKPAYDFFADGRLGGLTPDKQDRVRGLARAAIKAYLAGDGKLPPPPAPKTVRRMMDFIVGGEVPERYMGMMMEELAVDGVDPGRFQAPRQFAGVRLHLDRIGGAHERVMGPRHRADHAVGGKLVQPVEREGDVPIFLKPGAVEVDRDMAHQQFFRLR